MIQLIANDRDSGPNGQIVYSLLANDTNSVGLLEIDPNSGWIRTIGTLDYAVSPKMALTAIARDMGPIESLFSTAELIIEIKDGNNYAPEFTEIPYVVNISSKVADGQRIAKITAVDRDSPGPNSQVVYSFQSKTDEFNLNPQTGVISAQRPLNLRKGPFILKIIASDLGTPNSLSSTGLVQINVDSESNSESNFHFLKTPYFIDLEKNSAENSELIQVEVNDPSAPILFEIISGNDQEIFAIDHQSGMIKLRKKVEKIQRRNGSEMKLIVAANPPLASGSGSGSASIFAPILVRFSSNGNQFAPQFLQQRYFTAVFEGESKGTFVTQVKKNFFY